MTEHFDILGSKSIVFAGCRTFSAIIGFDFRLSTAMILDAGIYRRDGRDIMFKGMLGIAAVAAVLSIAPASAQMMDCTEANMTKASMDMDKMPAGEKKTMAMKEMDMAKDMMGKKDMAACKTHMNKAMEMGMSK